MLQEPNLRPHKDIHLSWKEIKMLMRLKRQKFGRLHSSDRDENYHELEKEKFVKFVTWATEKDGQEYITRGYEITNRGKEHLRHMYWEISWVVLKIVVAISAIITGIFALTSIIV